MRVTLKIDNEIATRLEKLTAFSSFNEAVNHVLRIGLKQLEGLEQLEIESTESQPPYRMQAVNLGPKITNIDNIAEILDLS